MKRLVNGKEAELTPTQAVVRNAGDRILVTSAEGTHSAFAVKKGDAIHVSYRGRQYIVEPVKAKRTHHGKDHTGDLISPLPGAVVEVLAEVGQTVAPGDKVVVLEAMKTQQTFVVPYNGMVTEIHVKKGDQIVEGTLLAVVEPIEQ